MTSPEPRNSGEDVTCTYSCLSHEPHYKHALLPASGVTDVSCALPVSWCQIQWFSEHLCPTHTLVPLLLQPHPGSHNSCSSVCHTFTAHRSHTGCPALSLTCHQGTPHSLTATIDVIPDLSHLPRTPTVQTGLRNTSNNKARHLNAKLNIIFIADLHKGLKEWNLKESGRNVDLGNDFAMVSRNTKMKCRIRRQFWWALLGIIPRIFGSDSWCSGVDLA